MILAGLRERYAGGRAYASHRRGRPAEDFGRVTVRGRSGSTLRRGLV